MFLINILKTNFNSVFIFTKTRREIKIFGNDHFGSHKIHVTLPDLTFQATGRYLADLMMLRFLPYLEQIYIIHPRRCPAQNIVASCGNDGIVRIFTHLLVPTREVILNCTLTTVSFLNTRGDILLGFLGNIYKISSKFGIGFCLVFSLYITGAQKYTLCWFPSPVTREN